MREFYLCKMWHGGRFYSDPRALQAHVRAQGQPPTQLQAQQRQLQLQRSQAVSTGCKSCGGNGGRTVAPPVRYQAPPPQPMMVVRRVNQPMTPPRVVPQMVNIQTRVTPQWEAKAIIATTEVKSRPSQTQSTVTTLSPTVVSTPVVPAPSQALTPASAPIPASTPTPSAQAHPILVATAAILAWNHSGPLLDRSYLSVPGATTSDYINNRLLVPVAGTLRGFYIRFSQRATGTSSDYWRFTVRVNGSETILFTHTNNGSDREHILSPHISVKPGNDVSISVTKVGNPGDVGSIQAAVHFVSTVQNPALLLN